MKDSGVAWTMYVISDTYAISGQQAMLPGKYGSDFMNSIVMEDCKYIADSVALDILDGSTIVITGAAGFLGRNFLNSVVYTAERGIRPEKIITLDNYKLGQPAWLEAMSKKHEFIVNKQFDIATNNLAGMLGNTQVDYVIHLASIASPIFYRQYPIETIDANVWGLRNLLEFFKDTPLKSMLFFSTSEIYGDPHPDFIPTNEEYRGNVACIGPRSCYDEAKRFGETLCYYFNKIHNIPIKIVRPFNNYGPGLNINDRRVVADFAKAILEHHDITLHSDGTPTRTFCYVADAIVGYWKALFYDKFDVFNIGIDRPEISIKELAGIYSKVGKDLFDYEIDIKFMRSDDPDYLTDNPNKRCPDISKARRLLDYEPKIDVNDGVRKYLTYLREETK